MGDKKSYGVKYCTCLEIFRVIYSFRLTWSVDLISEKSLTGAKREVMVIGLNGVQFKE